MKASLIYVFLPLAVGCSEHQKTGSSTKTSELVPKEPTRIMGVVSYDENCSIQKKTMPCLKIKGGDDLNDTKTFVLNDLVNGFEVIDNKSSPKTFRIWTKSKESPMEVFENEHVSIVAELQIGSIESVARLDK